jgi:hypothetical protein
MEYDDIYHPAKTNDYDSANGSELEKIKQADRGYTFVYKPVERKNGKVKNTKIDIYTSGDCGSRIRDAVSGLYYKETVGSNDEHLFFTVSLSTGKCRSKNGSNTLFYLSPEQFEKHLHLTVSQDVKNSWHEKKEHYRK